MKTIGNLVWLVFNGIWLALGYALLGLIVCAFVVTIPFGVQLFKLAGYALWPFGRVVVKRPGAGGASVAGNLLWLIPGVIIAIGHLIAAAANLLLCVFVITIPICLPFAIANLKLVTVALWPFGREVVPTDRLVRAPSAHVVGVPGPGRA